PSSQVRALARLSDRAGMHILAGCAADAVSYEATRFAQGLLTYCLLRGMRGEALREDRFVDVSVLFEFAADKVPELAHDIGGSQKPIRASPSGASFDIGMLLKEDKEKIPLEQVRPLVVSLGFRDKRNDRDTLG